MPEERTQQCMYLKTVLRRLDQTGHTVVSIDDVEQGVNLTLAGGAKLTIYKTGMLGLSQNASDHLRYVVDRLQHPENYQREQRERSQAQGYRR